MSNFHSPVKKEQPCNITTISKSKAPFEMDDVKFGRVLDRRQQQQKYTKPMADETFIERSKLNNPMNSMILGLGTSPPMCWNWVHPQLQHLLYSSNSKQTANQNEYCNASTKPLKRSKPPPPSSSLNNISYKLTKYGIPDHLRRVYRHLPMPIQKVFSYNQYANPKNNKKDSKPQKIDNNNHNILAEDKRCTVHSPSTLEATSLPSSSSGIFRYSEKWQEFQKFDSPIRVERTQHPIILGPYTTLEQFEHEIFKKINNFKIKPNQHQITVSHKNKNQLKFLLPLLEATCFVIIAHTICYLTFFYFKGTVYPSQQQQELRKFKPCTQQQQKINGKLVRPWEDHGSI